jgi:hypothetical protein
MWVGACASQKTLQFKEHQRGGAWKRAVAQRNVRELAGGTKKAGRLLKYPLIKNSNKTLRINNLAK